MKTKLTALLFAFLLFSIGCNRDDDNSNPSNPNVIPYQEGLTTNYITINNITRKYLVYRPAGMSSVNAVVTVLHGGGGTGLGVSNLGEHPLSVFRTLADIVIGNPKCNRLIKPFNKTLV